MAEYIDKDNFDKTLLMLGYDEKDLPRRTLAQQPAADVAPVVYGWWLHDYNNLWGCNVCLWRGPMPSKWKFKSCPNCGARMDLEE